MTRIALFGALVFVAGTAQAQVSAPPAAPSAPFTLSSTSITDMQPLARKHAGKLATNPNCRGDNISPQLSWSNVPQGAQSIAILMLDPEGRNGLGTSHWVAYGIPLSKTGFAEGEASEAPVGYMTGKGSQGLDRYLGPCTPPGTTWHHYSWVAMATDLAPDALPAGLTREELLLKLAGHTKASSGLIAPFKYQP